MTVGVSTEEKAFGSATLTFFEHIWIFGAHASLISPVKDWIDHPRSGRKPQRKAQLLFVGHQ